MTFSRKPIIIDAQHHIAGRLAATIAKQALLGQPIVVVRCEKIIISGPVARNKAKWDSFLRKRMATNPKKGHFHHKAPSKIFFRKIRGMLPYKSERGAQALKRIQVYDGIPAKYARVPRAHVPSAVKFGRIDLDREHTVLGHLSTLAGWKYGEVVKEQEEKRIASSKRHYHEVKALNNKYKNDAVKNVAENEEYKQLTQELAKYGF